MKRITLLLIFVMTVVCLMSCTDKKEVTPKDDDSSTEEMQTEEILEEEVSGENEDFLFDLDASNLLLNYYEYDKVKTSPQKYLGRTITLKGYYDIFIYDGEPHHYVVLSDTGRCCQEYVEFMVTGGYTYPDDYPETETETEIEICGLYKSYYDSSLDWTFYYLEVEEITILRLGEEES